MSDNIDKQNRREFEQRRQFRRDEDVRKGLTKAKGAQWGDYEINRKAEKVIQDYRRFKDPKDREKIKKEYFGRQQEYRKRFI